MKMWLERPNNFRKSIKILQRISKNNKNSPRSQNNNTMILLDKGINQNKKQKKTIKKYKI